MVVVGGVILQILSRNASYAHLKPFKIVKIN